MSGHLPESSGVINPWNMGAEREPGLLGWSFTRKSEGTGGYCSWTHQAPEGPGHWSKRRPVAAGAFWEDRVIMVLQLLFFPG